MRQENSKLANGCGCLVLLMCIGVLTAAIVLPSFLTMATNAKQSEAKSYVSSMNRGQQAYFAEDNAFATSVNALKIGIKTETINYKYSLRVTKTASAHYALPKQSSLKSYVGGVFVVPAKEVYPNAAKDQMKTTSILCIADDRGIIKPAEPIYQNGKVVCGKGTTEVTK